MDSRSENPTELSSLPDYVLLMIIANLCFKDALKTSVLSKKWRNISRRATNISFKESECATLSDSVNEDTKRIAFIHYVRDWVSKFTGFFVETFEFCISKPVDIETFNLLIEFAVSKNVKNLILDFADRSWNYSDDAKAEATSMLQLPECFYSLTNLESLSLSFCGFDPSKLVRLGSVKSLCFRWIQLNGITSLLSKAPLLQSLRIKNCWNVDLESITDFNNRLTTLVFKNNRFSVPFSMLDLPNIQKFKYSGQVHYFQFLQVNRSLEEAYLDFSEEVKYDEETGTQLCNLLYDLLSARTLTVCPFLLQLIQQSEDPIRLKAPMETRQLILKTSLLPDEYIGIRLLINSSPHLETLSLHILLRRPHDMEPPSFDPDTYWSYEFNHKCLKKTLKVVEFWNFSGDMNELYLLKFLINYGRGLERVDLYLPRGVQESARRIAHATAQMVGTTFERGSNRLGIYLHNG
ncbi:F-box protein [Cardamine amara subsp. amara]|uniref:F-box protein n=1 Tax=Cardamine amara subsp. amara TaxID=228776 RepID=A0ABD1BFF7_CARAN